MTTNTLKFTATGINLLVLDSANKVIGTNNAVPASSALIHMQSKGAATIPILIQTGSSSLFQISDVGGTGGTVIMQESNLGKVQLNTAGISYFNGGDLAIGRTTAAARTNIKGSGSTSGTLALLVENNSNLDSLQVFDSQEVVVGHINGSTPSGFFGLATQFGIQNKQGTGTNAFIINQTSFSRIVTVGDNGSFLSRTFDTTGGTHFQLSVADNSPSFTTFSNKQFGFGTSSVAGNAMIQINNQNDNSVSPEVPFTNILSVISTSSFVTMVCKDDGTFTTQNGATGVPTFNVTPAGGVSVAEIMGVGVGPASGTRLIIQAEDVNSTSPPSIQNALIIENSGATDRLRFIIDTDDSGKLIIGSGSVPNTTVDVDGDFATRVDSPASFAVNQDDFDNGAFSFLRLTNTSVASPDSVDITGFSNSADGKRVVVVNVSSTQDIIFKHEDASSTAANRFNNGNAAADKTLAPDDTIEYIYDSTDSRWRYIGGSV